MKHIIATRLLSRQMSVENILSNDVIGQHLDLVSRNLIPSLNNQTNRDFEFILLVNPKLEQSQIEMIQDRISASGPKFVWKTMLHDQTFDNYISSLWDENDVVAVTRIDDDDFVYKNAVNDVQKLGNDMKDDMVVCGYSHGYMFVDKCPDKIAIVDFQCIRHGYFSIFETFMYDTRRIKYCNQLNPYSMSHDLVKKILVEQGYNPRFVDFDVGDSKQYVVYFRHDGSQMSAYKNSTLEWQNKKFIRQPFTIDDSLKKKLNDVFGMEIRK